MQRVIAGLFLLLLPVPAAALAHTSFDEESTTSGYGASEGTNEATTQTEPAEVTVPSNGESVREVEFNQAPTSGTGSNPSLFGQPAELLSQTGLPAGTSQLPYILLPVSLDLDQDGLSTSDERVLGTDPQRADSDGDSYIDGLEIVRGYNPLVPSPGDQVTYTLQQDSAVGGYSVTGVRTEERGGQELLVVTGMAPEHAVVLLVVASDSQRVWPTRADSSGRFLYTSADTLEIGEHTVHAAAPAVDGRLLADGAFLFRRTTNGVELPPSPTPVPVAEAGVVGRWLVPSVVALGGLLVLGAMFFFVRRAGQLRRSRGAAALHQQLQQSPPDS